VGSATAQKGYDLFLTPVGDEYVVEAGTERGGELLEKHADTTPAQAAHVAGVKEHLDKKVAAQKSRFADDVSALPLLLDTAWDSAVWARQAEETCWSCGRCNLVCPTCFCFDVNDVVELSLAEGWRERVWDGCLLPDFAAVASGENFREDKAQRLRHRFYRKFQYLYTKYGEPYCTGCGRCGRSCVPGITVPGVVNDLLAESKKEG
jgi:ferredoxin